jgi:hypothetical protein
VGRQSNPSTVPLDPSDSAGSEHDVTGVESSVKAMRGAESLAADLPSVGLLALASPSAATKTHTHRGFICTSLRQSLSMLGSSYKCEQKIATHDRGRYAAPVLQCPPLPRKPTAYL